MNIGKALRTAAACIAGTLACASAQATAPGLFRAYLSINGSDSNPCTLPQPCRLLPAAIAAVADGGEVWILDSGNFNSATVTVAKSVTITAIPGVIASVVALAGPAISIDTTLAAVSLSLNNLRITHLAGGTGTDGIVASGGAFVQLVLQGVTVQGHAGRGVSVPIFGEVRILNSIIRDNNFAGVRLSGGAYGATSGSTFNGNGFGDGSAGIELADASHEISSVTMFGNYNGVKLTATTTSQFATISNSVIASGNDGILLKSLGAGGSSVRMVVTNSTISENTIGLEVGSAANTSATLSVGHCTISGNQLGLSNDGVAGAVLNSLGNNFVTQNTSDSFGAITTIPAI